MRDILFRGKCKDTGQWYTGHYIHLRKTTYCFKEDYDKDKDNDIHQIVFEKMTDWGLPNQHYRVDVVPETVGQYTGLTNEGGDRIYEGDIVKVTDDNGSTDFSDGGVGVVEFYDGLWYVNGEVNNGLSDLTKTYYIEIIGNIHDNPELLSGDTNVLS